MEKRKFRISIIDFLKFHKTVEVGTYQDGTKAYLGDCVEYLGEQYLIAYRYDFILLKQVGIWALIEPKKFKNGDFSDVNPTNIVMAGTDWLIIGYDDEPIFKELSIKGVPLS